MVYATAGTIQTFLSSPINVFIVLVAFVLITSIWSMRRPAGLPPGPRGLPFIGSIGDLAKSPVHTICDFAKTYGDIFTLKIGMQCIVVLNKIDLVREALLEKQDEFAGRPWIYTMDLLSEGGQNIINCDFTKKWKVLRKVGHQAIRNYASGYTLEKIVTKEAFPRIKKAVVDKNGEPFDPKSILTLFVCNVISNICFGHNYDLDDTEFKNIIQITDDMNDVFGSGTTLADLQPIFKYIPTEAIRQMKKVSNTWLTFIQSKVDDHRMNMQEGSVSDVVHDVLKFQAELKCKDQADELTDVHVRQILADIFGGGYNIPKGTQIWTNLWSLHMDEEYWEEPEKFSPERFLDDEGNVRKRQDSYLPFSAGRRVCLGEVLARNGMLLIFTCLFQHFTLSPVKGNGNPSLDPNFDYIVTRCIPYDVVAKERISRQTDSQA
ncbi:cytochrome P450 1A1-like isoform X2 [Ptychodera flava]|uniref:cytochrome P450 1A1-like isoform X2 n=1 Tax=Ptychodera flava TaxID=63121 RepID=UPI00396A44E1